MHRGLIKLLLLQAKATARRMFRGARSVRGAMFLLVGIMLFVGWLGPSLFLTHSLPRTSPETVRMYFPIALLAFCAMNLLTSAGERAIAFTPAEVDFLFPGPFTRRQLLGYKIARSFFGALLSAFFFSIFLMRHVQHWLAGFIGVLLAIMFMQVLSMTIVFVGQIVGEGAFSRGRKVLLIGLVFAAVASLGPSFARGSARDLPEIAFAFAHSPSGKLVLSPFNVFGQIMSADLNDPQILKWIAIALTMIGVLTAFVMLLDANYLEVAASAGQKRYDQIRRMRGGAGMAGRVSATSRLRIPMLPRLGGAGSISWRQMVSALRKSRGLLLTLLFVCLIVGPVIYTSGLSEAPQSLVIGAFCWVTFLLANLFRFDFRGDIDHIDTLKALPISAVAVAIAELITPVVMLTLCQVALMIGLGTKLKVDPRLITAVFVYALPLNIVLIMVENLMFLIFPMRIVAVAPGDLQGVGRQMIAFLVRGITLLVCGGFAGGIGAIAWFLSGQSLPVFAITTLIVLLGEIIGMVPLLVMAFRHFDPSVDTPA